MNQMIPRMRVFAGPNGSGKSTLAQWLSRDYAVNLYRYINADVLFAEINATRKTACPFTMETAHLLSFVQKTTYPDAQKNFFLDGKIRVEDESVCFGSGLWCRCRKAQPFIGHYTGTGSRAKNQD